MKNKLNLRDLKENTNRNPNIKQHVMLPLFNMQDTIVWNKTMLYTVINPERLWNATKFSAVIKIFEPRNGTWSRLTWLLIVSLNVSFINESSSDSPDIFFFTKDSFDSLDIFFYKGFVLSIILIFKIPNDIFNIKYVPVH